MLGKLEQYISGAWVDLSSRVPWRDSPVSISRGVSEDGTPAAGTMTVVLENSDGVLTPGSAGLVRWRPIRLHVWADGAWRLRFFGFVDSEVLSWPTGVAEYCVVTVMAVDLIARLAAGSLSQVSANMVLATSPIAYWSLTDSGAPAANLSGVTHVDLVEGQIGEGGGLEWGGGTKLPSDNSAGLMITAGAGGENGPFLRSGEFDLPAAWSLAINFTPSTAEPDGVLVELGDDQRYVRIWWDSATRKCSAVLSVHDPAGYYEIQLSESASAIPAGMVYRETLEFTGTHWRLGSASGPVAESTGLPSLVWVSVGGATGLSPSSALTGGVAHLAIWSGALPSLPVNLTPSAANVQSWVQQLADWAGVSATVVTSGANRGTVMPATDGQSAAAVIGALAQGSLGRIYADRAGGLTVASWDHYPAPISPPAGEIDPGIEWMADPDGDPTMVTMTWPDGTIYRAIRSGERPVDLPGVLAVAAGQSAADWVARVGTAATPRIGEVVYDLVTLPEATRAALAGLDVGDRISIGNLPSQLPSSSQVAVVDAVSETIGVDQWTLTLRTSPHGRDQVFSAGDATRGKVGAGYRAAPFDPAVEGPWKAGEEVTAARLNARAYVGGAVQAGRVTITPVANADTSLAVTFPTTFTSTPRVVVTADTPAPESEVKSVTISNVTTSGFTLWIRRTNTTATPVDWLAVP